MKKLNVLNLGKSLKREEMKSIKAGLYRDPDLSCTCGTKPRVDFVECDCKKFCENNGCPTS